jgi:formylglycine-generating enzyme required for sulfatase activity
VLRSALFVALTATGARAVTIDWVTVGDAGNANDTINTGTNPNYGAVGYEYQIMKFEWTNSQYVEFLNAVDPDGTNPYSIYNSLMGSNARGGISFTTGNTAGSKYAARTNMGDKPVNFVNWFDAARVSNWLMNGATGTSSTETGAYTLVGGQTSGTAPAKNPGAQFYIPTENEWYKAAYYKGSGTNAGYWEYATQVTGTAPIAVGATVVGTGTSGGVSPVNSGNFANCNSEADWNSQDGNVTTVGSNGGPSAYGAFDMSGNVYEWNDLDGTADSSRGRRGGSWINTAFNASSSDRNSDPAGQQQNGLNGFRLASPLSGPSGVPEIDPAGLGSVLALVTGALGLLERRRIGR